MMLNVLNQNLPMAAINKTNIVLIPKTAHPSKMTEFRPISLGNLAYKLISKTLTNRLKAILPTVITGNQSVFTSDRLTIDNVLVAFELMHYLNHKTKGKDCFMSVKLDISKAFDRVEWGFVREVRERLGFDGKWISLIMQCISSVSYSVIINGEAYGSIIPTRGLKQGDRLFPGLFLLCAEGLSALIHQAACTQALQGISICRGRPNITHLFFADDSLLFCKASAQQCLELVQILNSYKVTSRQKINADKSSVFFSLNTPNDVKEEILSILGPMQCSQQRKYLGLPYLIGKSKSQVFAEIKERGSKKLASWKEKLLSIGGREILIKSVAQPVPTYTMSCFQLSKTLCDDLERMIRNFW